MIISQLDIEIYREPGTGTRNPDRFSVHVNTRFSKFSGIVEKKKTIQIRCRSELLFTAKTISILTVTTSWDLSYNDTEEPMLKPAVNTVFWHTNSWRSPHPNLQDLKFDVYQIIRDNPTRTARISKDMYFEGACWGRWCNMRHVETICLYNSNMAERSSVQGSDFPGKEVGQMSSLRQKGDHVTSRTTGKTAHLACCIGLCSKVPMVRLWGDKSVTDCAHKY